LNFSEASSRDKSEIENLNKGGPIAMADYTVTNESDLDDLRRQTEKIRVWFEKAI
jgi:dephospho-CoA kinase